MRANAEKPENVRSDPKGCHGHVCIGGFKTEMIMGPHEAKSVASPIVSFNDSIHELDEFFPVLFIMEDRHLSDTTAYDMIRSTRQTLGSDLTFSGFKRAHIAPFAL